MAHPTAVTTFTTFRAALDDGRVDVLDSPPNDTDDHPGERDSRLLIDGIRQLAVRLLESRGLTSAGPFPRLLGEFADAPLPYQRLLDREVLTASPIFGALDHPQLRSLLEGAVHLDLIDVNPVPASAGTEPTVLHVQPLMRDAGRRYADPAHDETSLQAMRVSRISASRAAGR